MEYSYVAHTVTEPEVDDSPFLRRWFEAVEMGFHNPRPTDSLIHHHARIEAERQSVLRGAYATTVPSHALPADQPVATFTEWEGSLNIGGALIPVHQISDVTVRPSHRRRGLLRTLMTDSLSEAAQRGLPIAALTATEATIYGRFGFGAAVFSEEIELSCSPGFALTTPLNGVVDHLDPADLMPVTTDIFEAFHASHTGSINRVPSHHKRILGTLKPPAFDEVRELRAAAHWDDDGTIDGYVTWKVNSKGNEAVVVDMISTNEPAQLSLWEFLGSLDLIEKFRAERVPTDSALPWSLVDRRWYRVQASCDHLWLRILDPVKVLTSRDYVHEGSVSIRVVDDLGFADGQWHINVVDGHATVEPLTSAQADVELDVAALASSVLNGVRVSALSAAGLIRGEQRHIDVLESLLARRRAPWCATPF